VPQVDLPLDQLQVYRPELTAQPDFAAFWKRTLTEAAAIPLNVTRTRVDYPVDEVVVEKLTYDGWHDARICGWYISRQQARTQPTLVFYHGYSGNKGQVHDYLGWALLGYTVLAVDARGQLGESTDGSRYPGGHAMGWMTLGITSPDEYYYRGVYVDCLRALDAVVAQPEVDPDRIGVVGASQGGGLSLAVAALDARPKLALAEIPFLCHFRRGVDLSSVNPYLEIANYCTRRPENTETAFRTLSYFDNVNLADRITCPVLMTVGLQDVCCPPSTIYAVYNRIATQKEMRIYPFGGHEVFPTHHEQKHLWARTYLKRG
jgi:cephalosporin-C deacetylase